MKHTIKVEKEVKLKTLHVEAHVRHWENADVNGERDTENGDNIPCKEGEIWKPVIDLETGQILNWEQGKTASVHYKVVDEGSYFIKDDEGNMILSRENDYVPSILCPKENGYGDYIIMDIDAQGFIQNWEIKLDDFRN